MHKAFSMGTDYGFFNIDTTDDAIYASECYRDIPPDDDDPICETIPSVGKFNEYFDNKKIIFLSGHSCENLMRFKWCHGGDEVLVFANGTPGTISQDGIYNIADRQEETDLIVYSGCCTARGNDNITQRTGAFYKVKTVLGWSTTISSPQATKWNEYFNYAIKQSGVRVDEAIRTANSVCYFPFSGVKNVVIKGERELILNTSTQLNNIKENLNSEKDRQIHIDNDVAFTSYEDIEKVIKQTDSEFDLKQYRIIESKGSSEFDSIIDITRKIGIFDTVSGYTVFIKAGVIDSIYDNRLVISKNEIANISDLEELPSDKINENIDSVIEGISKEQKIKINEKIKYYYYDVEKKETYLMVLIDYVSVYYGYYDLHLEQIKYSELEHK